MLLEAEVEPHQDAMRLDLAAAELFPAYSRSRIQAWIKTGELQLNGATAGVRHKVAPGDRVVLQATPEPDLAWKAEELALEFVYRDDSIAVINKPAGMVTHPGAGNWSGTLANGLLHHIPSLAAVPRAGIVHRLDKDTSGLLVIGLDLAAHQSLVQQLQARTVTRQYMAFTIGHPGSKGTVDKPLGRHPRQRQKMAVRREGGKQAITHFETQEYLDGVARVSLKLETGRTHQIRVHMAELGYPLLGDPLYGGRLRKNLSVHLEAISKFSRQALHAEALSLQHPATGEIREWHIPLPEDMRNLLDQLRQ
ncbi:MAG: 23S rRNA pseudouridine(1911/1915/1917) synthase RluD [Pseudomonadales bacterium]